PRRCRPARSSEAPAEAPAGDLLDALDIGREELGHAGAKLRGELGLLGRPGVRSVHQPLDRPAQPLREAVEVAVEPPEARQADGSVHEAEATRALCGSRLPLALE